MVATDEKSGHVEDLGAAKVDADPLQLYSVGRSPSYYQALGTPVGTLEYIKSASATNCTSSRITTLSSAHAQAKTYAANSVSYLNAGSTGARYTTWFGSYTSSRYTTVKSHFTKINSALINSAITYDCYCQPSSASAYAYVYPSQPYIIHLCNAFWSAPTAGTDSRGGTIIHEMSHFTVNGGTGDYAYGQSSAKSLATSNPSTAIQNADNHEYFSENTPYQN
jgi:peptidyl-Lys metalloendopeptidase